MKNMLLKFRSMDSSTQKSLLAAIAVGVISVFVVIGAIVDSFPKNEVPEPIVTEAPVEDIKITIPEEQKGDGAELGIPVYVQEALSETQNFLITAATEICKRSYGESEESIITRLSPYVLSVEDKASSFQSTELVENCSNVLGTQYVSYDESERVIEYKIILTQQFTLLADKDLPEAERLKGERYLKYVVEIQKQADGSWKIINLQEINI